AILQMPVDGVVAEVGLAADEPFGERRPRVIEHLAERLVPVDALRFRGPEAFAVEDRAAMEFLIGRHALRSTTMRPVTLALMKSSNTFGKSAKGMVFAMSFRPVGFMSPASRSQTLRSSSGDGASVELMPSRLTPRRIKGITVVFRPKPAARPIEAITPLNFIVLAIHARTSPQRLSIAPCHLALSRGLIFVRSISFLNFTSLAPSF